MSVTNTQFATNTYKITIANELVDSNNVIAGVNTAITTLGWSLYDSVDQTTYSPIVTRVYRVLNTDATTYKYAILRYDTLRLRINLSCCESWNNSTHVATNESWHSDGAFFHGYDLRQSTIYVNSNARHLLLQTWILGEPGHWAGIFETERVAPEDIAANSSPCFFYTNSLMLGTPWGTPMDVAPSFVTTAFPRTPDGLTDYAAAGVYAPTTSRGMWPPYYPSGNTANVGGNTVYSNANTDGNSLHLGSWWMNIGAGAINPETGTGGGGTSQGPTWGWDSAATPVTSVSIDAIRKHMPFGRIYDIGVTVPLGTNQLETTYFTANTAGGWPDTTGSNTEFLLLPLNGGSYTKQSNNNNVLVGNYGQTVINSGINSWWANTSTATFSSLTSVGNNVWAGANNGIWYWNQTIGSNTLPVLAYFNSNGIYDLMFDGKRSIYGTTNTGLIQIDTETLATNSITSANITAQGGCAYLNMDNKYIYATNRTSNTRPYCHQIYRSNNAVNPNTIQLASAVSLNVASGWGTPMPDYNGFVYLVSTPGTTSSQQTRQLVANVELGVDGVANSIVPWFTQAAHAADGDLSNIYLEPFSNRLYHFQISTRSNGGYGGNIIEYSNDRTFTQIANAIGIGITIYSNPGGQYTGNSQLSFYNTTGTIDYRGDLQIYLHRGHYIIQAKRNGMDDTGVSGTAQPLGRSISTQLILHHPNPNPSTIGSGNGYMWVSSSGNPLRAGSPVIVNASQNGSSYNYSSGVGIVLPTRFNYNAIFTGSSNYTYTNGIRIISSIFAGNAESRIQVQNNYFTLYPLGGYPTSRLLVKA